MAKLYSLSTKSAADGCSFHFLFGTDVEMSLALRLLPVLLNEAPLPVAATAGKRKRNSWRPTTLETMKNFIDVQKV